VQPEAIDEIANLVHDILVRARTNRIATICSRFFVTRPSLQCRDLSLAVECIERVRFRGVKSEDSYRKATRVGAKCKGNLIGKRLIVEWRRKPGYRVIVNNKRSVKSG